MIRRMYLWHGLRTCCGYIFFCIAMSQSPSWLRTLTTGAGLAPFDSWLILRGVKTLGIRMERAQENAKVLADPATQTHADVPEKIRLKNGITDATLRLSIGIEDVKDLVDRYCRNPCHS